MTYKETLEYLYNAAPAFEKVGAGAYKEGLANTLALDAHFHHPHRQYHTIHVAGTNGKGSTSHTIASILQECGLKVGLYTSPHLVDFNERIRVNGIPIPHQYVIDFVEQERHFFEPLCPSFFELTTALAFKYFADQEVDIAVIEVGLGGRLDCTNIITPLLSIITNISFDHTNFLGDTLEKIAREKAGIIKHNVTVVIGEDDEHVRPVFADKAREQNAQIIFAQDKPMVLSDRPCESGGRVYHTACFGEIRGDLSGDYQVKNTNTVLTAILPLAKALSKTALWHKMRAAASNGWLPMLRSGFANVCKNTGLTGRWQTVDIEPLTICDTGHNVGGWLYLSRQISETYTARKALMADSRLHIVFGMVDDKDIDTVLTMLPKDAEMYFTQADSHRAIPAKTLQSKASRHGIGGTAYETVKEAYRAARLNATTSDFIFVGGSSYVVADFLLEYQLSKILVGCKK